MTFDVESYCTSKGMVLKRRAGNNLAFLCPFHGEAEGKPGRFYINVDPSQEPLGLFKCFVCEESGAINKLLKHFGDPILRDNDDYDSTHEETPKLMRLFQCAVDYYYENLADHTDALTYLKDERGLSFETIEKHKLGWADGGLYNHLKDLGFELGDMIRSGLVKDNKQDFLVNKIAIPYFRYGNPVQVRGKEIGGKYYTPSGQKALPYNHDEAWNAETVVVCEGEFDCLMLEQLGFSAIGVPGAISWQDSWNDVLEDCKRVFICFDPDNAGKAGAEKTALKIGSKARIVNLPEPPAVDISDLVNKFNYSKADFDLLLIRSRGGILVSVEEAYEKWQEVEGNKNLVGFKFGIDVLDRLIDPGLLPGQVYLSLAKTGSGKTISLINFFYRSLAANPDNTVLFFSLEQTRNEWFERARRIHRFYDLDATDRDTVDFYKNRLMIVDQNRISEDQFASAIEQFEYELGKKPSLVAVDYLGYWARSYKGDSYERTSAAVMALKAMGKDFEVPIFAPHQVSRGADAGDEFSMGSARDSGVVEETGDFVSGLWAEDQKLGIEADKRTNKVRFKLFKSRHGNANRGFDFQFAPLSLALVPTTDKMYNRALDEHKMALSGLSDFDKAIAHHRQAEATGRKYTIQ